jgi:hypothetical protein
LFSSNHNCLRPVRSIDSLLPSTFPRLWPLRWSPRDLQSVNHNCLRVILFSVPSCPMILGYRVCLLR